VHAIKARPARRSWMGPVLLLSDVDLLRTAGLDALVRPAASPASLRMYHAPLALRTRAPCGRLRCQGRDGLGRGAAERARPLGASPTGRRRAGVCAACVLTALGSQPRRVRRPVACRARPPAHGRLPSICVSGGAAARVGHITRPTRQSPAEPGHELVKRVWVRMPVTCSFACVWRMP